MWSCVGRTSYYINTAVAGRSVTPLEGSNKTGEYYNHGHGSRSVAGGARDRAEAGTTLPPYFMVIQTVGSEPQTVAAYTKRG
jgi:hypothetical protein